MLQAVQNEGARGFSSHPLDSDTKNSWIQGANCAPALRALHSILRRSRTLTHDKQVQFGIELCSSWLKWQQLGSAASCFTLKRAVMAFQLTDHTTATALSSYPKKIPQSAGRFLLQCFIGLVDHGCQIRFSVNFPS